MIPGKHGRRIQSMHVIERQTEREREKTTHHFVSSKHVCSETKEDNKGAVEVTVRDEEFDRLNVGGHWKLWGPYLSERQWGTVREDYSTDGNWYICLHKYFLQENHPHAVDGAYLRGAGCGEGLGIATAKDHPLLSSR